MNRHPALATLLTAAVAVCGRASLAAGLPQEPGADSPELAWEKAPASDHDLRLHHYLRYHGRRNVSPYKWSRSVQSIKDGLEWLARHQDEDGSWDCDEFMKHDLLEDRCDGAGRAENDVAVTGLALLAFLGDGQRATEGFYQRRVSRATRRLKDQQDPDTGRFGPAEGRSSLYSHAIATAALCEAYTFTGNPLLLRPLERSSKGAVGKWVSVGVCARHAMGVIGGVSAAS